MVVSGIDASEAHSSGKTVVVMTHENVSNYEYDRIITLNDGFVVSDKKKNNKRKGAL